jgi:membrane protein DedA with SNARE-associated domain
MEELLRRYGLWAVFFGTMIEGDLTLLLSGVLARAGLFAFEDALLVGTAGGIVGDSISYLIGFRFRNSVQNLKFFKKARPRLEALLRKFGVLSVFIVKYVWGLRTASAIFWGLAHFGFVRFFGLTVLSCAVWVGILAGIGFTFATGVEKVMGDLRRIQIALLIIIGIILLVFLIGRFERTVIETPTETTPDEEKKE